MMEERFSQAKPWPLLSTRFDVEWLAHRAREGKAEADVDKRVDPGMKRGSRHAQVSR
jgi:hypothetical protein